MASAQDATIRSRIRRTLNRRRKWQPALLLCALFWGGVFDSQWGLAGDSSISVNGSLQSDLGIQLTLSELAEESTPPTDAEIVSPQVFGGGLFSKGEFSGNSLLTFQMKTTGLENARVEASLDVGTLYGRAAALYLQSQPEGGLVAGGVPLYLDLRKLSGTLYFPHLDVSLGRQIVNFGTGTVFSPIDVFSSVELLELSFRRRGSDVLRMRVPLGDLGGIEALVGYPSGLTGEGAPPQSTALKVFGNLGGWDVSGVGLLRVVPGSAEVPSTRTVRGGVAFKGDLIVGLAGEVVVQAPFGGAEGAETPTIEAMVGMDYSVELSAIDSRLVLMAEYLYRDEALGQSGLYDQHTFFGSLSLPIDDLRSVSVAALGSYPAKDWMVTPQFSWNVLQGVNAIFYARAFHIAAYEGLLPDGEVAVRVVVKF